MVTTRIFGTLVTVKATVLVVFVAVWGGLTWLGLRRHPKRGFGRSLLIGLASLVVLLPVDFGHAFAHIFSARYARAPMDELRITAGMPRTLYWNNAVSPDVHRLRALGGPIFNALGFLLSLAIYRAVPRRPIARELAGWSALGHGLLVITSLLPLPMVDGGTLLKWTLVARGRPEAEADALVRRVDRGMGVLGVVIGLGLVIGVLRRGRMADRPSSDHRGSPPPPADRAMVRVQRSAPLMALLRLPVYLYRLGLGRLLGHRFLMLTHRGRKSGRPRQTVLEVTHYDPRTRESVVVSGWGKRADWYQNIQASPAIEVQTGGERYVPACRVLAPAEAYDVTVGYDRRLPPPLRPIARLVLRRFGFDVAGTEEARRAHAASLLFVAFRPSDAIFH